MELVKKVHMSEIEDPKIRRRLVVRWRHKVKGYMHVVLLWVFPRFWYRANLQALCRKYF